jgi:hypothetical protein
MVVGMSKPYLKICPNVAEKNILMLVYDVAIDGV